ncbi:hypothetical protein KIPB_012737, partial [Kipferlia bialata]|eukprot:g12737.t1
MSASFGHSGVLSALPRSRSPLKHISGTPGTMARKRSGWIRLGPVLNGSVSGRYGHSLDVLGGRVYLFGGYAGQYSNDLFSCSPRDGVFSPTLLSGSSPSPRRGHVSVSFGRRLLIMGGDAGNRCLSDVWVFSPSQEEIIRETDPIKGAWKRVTTAGEAPAARYGHAAVRINHLVYVYGGADRYRGT